MLDEMGIKNTYPGIVKSAMDMLILTMVWLMIPYLQSWFALWPFFIDGLRGKCDRDRGKIQRQYLVELEELQQQEGLRLGKS